MSYEVMLYDRCHNFLLTSRWKVTKIFYSQKFLLLSIGKKCREVRSKFNYFDKELSNYERKLKNSKNFPKPRSRTAFRKWEVFEKHQYNMLKTFNFMRKLDKSKIQNDLVKNFPLPGRKETVTTPRKKSVKMSD
jgi:hypothetical protein